ncbi:MAG: glycosyltransferase family protein [Pseudobdellovibrionaceae bacterium]
MRRIAIYCQHLLGVGHLTRVLNISEFLAPWAEVHLIQGGPEAGKTLIHKNFHHHKLPPLLMHEETKEMYDPSGKHTTEEVLEARKHIIEKIVQDPFDALLVELFPFGRNKLKTEILGLIEKTRLKSGKIPVFCSVRDIIVKKKDRHERDQKIVHLLNQFFDLVFVHSDQRIIRFEESFTAYGKISSKVHYTGFIGPKIFKTAVQRDPKRVVISQGGSDVGLPLLIQSIPAAAEFPEFQFHVVVGSRTEKSKKEEIENLASRYPNVRVHEFMGAFPEFLAGSALSISMGGYNTLMELVQTATPALIYPYGADEEQRVRAERFEKKGLVHLIGDEHLKSKEIVKRIKEVLALTYPPVDVNLNGAEATALLMKEFIETRDI